jgi:putative ABC transport system permease protein
MDTLLQDLRYAVRMLLKSPGFTAVAVATLALGIGANTAIFSVVNAVVLRPLPYLDPARLMMVWLDNPRQSIHEDVSSFPNFVDWREQNRVFDPLVTFYGTGFNLTGGGEPEQIRGAVVSAGFFRLFGVEPLHGRGLATDENEPGREQVVVLGHGLFKRRFGADPTVVGRTVSLGGRPFTVVGVMPPGFRFPAEAELWVPLAPTGPFADLMGSRNSLWLKVVGRLKPGVTLAQAQAQMSALAAALEKQYPDANAGYGVNLEPLHEEIVGGIRPALMVLLGAVALVLMIACANVANLLLARAATRQKEMAIRSALGAGRRRVTRQLLTESVLLSLVGGTLGFLLALWAVDLLLALSPPGLPRLDEVGVDGRVLLFTLMVAVLTGLIFGLAPAVQTWKLDLNESLKEGGRASSEGGRSRRVRGLLVVGEMALALILLVGAGLLFKSFLHLREVEPGLDPRELLSARISLPRLKYQDGPPVVAFYDQLLERVRALPGVESASAISTLLLGRLAQSTSAQIEGRPPSSAADLIPVPYDSITPGLFRTLGTPLLRGRHFTERDDARTPPVAIINDTMARRFWPGQDPIGRRFTFGDPRQPDTVWFSVVGVTGDVKRSGLDSEPRPESFFPLAQSPDRTMTLVVRARTDAAGLAAAVRSAVWSIDPDLPVSDVRTVEELLAESVMERRFTMLLVGFFSAVALVLSALGIYGVIAYWVTQRTHEIGVRMALGARPADVQALVLRQGLRLAGLGIALGLAGAVGATRVLRSLLYGVSATDPATFAAIPALLAFVALLACYVPARRATRVDPLIALRCE